MVEAEVIFLNKNKREQHSNSQIQKELREVARTLSIMSEQIEEMYDITTLLNGHMVALAVGQKELEKRLDRLYAEKLKKR